MFELEQKILNCWNIINDIRLITRSYDDSAVTEDQKMNMLIGTAEIYDRKFDELFKEYEKILEERAKMRVLNHTTTDY